MSPPNAHNLDARSAELIARQINSAFMNAHGFGMDHPTTERALDMFHTSLADALEKDPTLSLILDRGALFIEKHPVGARFNPKRMIESFNEMGLESITFSTGFSATDASALISVLVKLLDYPSLAAAEADLGKHQSGAIQFNHIVYRKVTSDEKVVSSSDRRAAAGHGQNPPEFALSAGERAQKERMDTGSLSLEASKQPEQERERRGRRRARAARWPSSNACSTAANRSPTRSFSTGWKVTSIPGPNWRRWPTPSAHD